MATKHAKTLDDDMLETALAFVGKGEHPLRDQVMVLLSFKGGLRAQEIAGLEWTDVSDALGRVRSDAFLVPGDVAKGKHEREVPMNPALYRAMRMLRLARPTDRFIAYGVKHEGLSPISVRVWFYRLYEKLNFDGCSSHSGRRTFITKLARRANQHDCSIKDVQLLAGHKRLETTEKYIEASPSVRRLVAAI